MKIDEPTVAPLADGLDQPIDNSDSSAGPAAGRVQRARRWSVPARQALDLLRSVAAR